MSYHFVVAGNRTDNIVGSLPLKSSGFGWTIQNATNVTFTLDTKHKACPKNWKGLIESGTNYIVAVRDGAPVDEKMVGYRINGWSENGNGIISIRTSSWESCFNNVKVGGPRFDMKDSSSEVFYAVANTVNRDGVGPNMTFLCPPSGHEINKYVKIHDRLTPRDVMDDIASDFEWTTYVVWDDAERSKFRKVTETGVPHLSPDVAEPSIAFTRDINGKGNIIDYSFTDSRKEDEYATLVVATGDGVDEGQIESAPKIDHYAEDVEGRDRVEKYENFPGVTTVAEANIMVQRMADNLFNKRNVITLKVASDGAVKPWQVERGMFVRLSLWTRAGNHIYEVWRVIALSESTDGKSFMPTLAKIGVKPVDFPRPPDISEIGNKIKDLYKRTEYGYNRNPNANGVYMRNARINDDGSIQRRNTDGSYSPPTSGPTGYVWLGTVKSIANGSAVVSMRSGGMLSGDQQAAVWTLDTIAVGDIVVLSKDGDTGGYVVIGVADERVDSLKMASFTITDSDNASGFGTNSLLQLVGGDMYVFTRNDGMKTVPRVGSGTFNGFNVFGGHIYATSVPNLGVQNPTVWRHVKGGTTWEEVTGLPSTTDAIYPDTSFVEPDSTPTVVTVAKSSIVNNTSSLSFTVTVWRLDSNGVTWVGRPYPVTTPNYTDANGNPVTLSGGMNFAVTASSRFAFLELNVKGALSYSVIRIDNDLNVVSTVQGTGGLMKYVSGESLTTSSSVYRSEYRVSHDGTISVARIDNSTTQSLTVYARGILGGAKPSAVVSTGKYMHSLHVQRDGSSDTWYVSASVSDTASSSGRMRSMLWHVIGSNSVSVVADRVDPDGTLTTGVNAQQVAYAAWPYQDASGKINAVLADTASYKMQINYFTPF